MCVCVCVGVYGAGESDERDTSSRVSGTQFTCSTSAKVPILTQKALQEILTHSDTQGGGEDVTLSSYLRLFPMQCELAPSSVRGSTCQIFFEAIVVAGYIYRCICVYMYMYVYAYMFVCTYV